MKKEKNNTIVAFCTWGITQEQNVMVNKIVEHFKTCVSNVDVFVIDLKTQGFDILSDIYIIFGSGMVSMLVNADSNINKDNYFECPSLKMMTQGKEIKESKIKTMEILKSVADHIKGINKTDQEMYLETSEGVTVGTKATDIEITQEEAQHLKNIKDILGGGKIVIVKGDIRIEVENGRDRKD